MFVLDTSTVRALDARAIAAGTPGSILMERAGYGAFLFLTRAACPHTRRVLVVAGKGNNAGDAFVTAYYLVKAGVHVELRVLCPVKELPTDAAEKWERLNAVLPAAPASVELHSLRESLVNWHGDLIIDGLLGTGLRGELAPAFRVAIDAINAHPAPVLALDIPSGLDADSGQPHGAAVRATWTVTFGHPKRGMLEPGALDYCGRIEVVDIGLERAPGIGEVMMLSSCEAAELVPVRRLDTHKHACGHVLVIAGSYGMTGAAVLCARAALATGAGLVTLAVPNSLLPLVAPACPACMTVPLPDERSGMFRPPAFDELLNLLPRFSAFAIGPGLSRAEPVAAFLKELLPALSAPAVLDADALNCLATMPDSLAGLRNTPCILTPHRGEFMRLSGTAPGHTPRERIAAASAFATSHALTLLLKGHLSVIASPAHPPYINPTGNPGMATAGSGDVLTGMAAALLAQGLAPHHAASLAAYLHGLAGDCAAARLGSLALTAPDIIDHIGPAASYLSATRLCHAP